MFQLSGMDSMFFHLESDNRPMHISSCIIFKPKRAGRGKASSLDITEIRSLFENCLLPQVPILKCKIQSVAFDLDQPYWIKEENFNLDFHLRHIALPSPGNWDDLRDMIAQLHSRPLDQSRPLWESYIIEGLNHVEGVPKGSFALFMKVHHSIMDGRTGRNIMTGLLSLSPDDKPIASNTEEHCDDLDKLFKKPNFLQTVSRSYISNAKKTWHMAGLFAKKLPMALGKLELAKYRDEIRLIPEREKTRFNKKITSKRVMDRIHVPLDDIKKIRKAVDGAKVNDVMLTIVGGAMLRYLQAKNETPEISLVAGAPVDVRDDSDESVQGNMVSFMNTSLCTDIIDPLMRMEQVHKEAMNAKNFSTTLGHRTLYDLLESVYSGLTAYGLRSIIHSGLLDKVPPVANTIVSNVPSIPLKLYLAGAELIDSFGMGPLLPNIGLFHVISGVNKVISISFTACAEALPDSEFYAICLEESYIELRDAAFEVLKETRTIEKQSLKEVS